MIGIKKNGLEFLAHKKGFMQCCARQNRNNTWHVLVIYYLEGGNIEEDYIMPNEEAAMNVMAAADATVTEYMEGCAA